MSFIANDTTRVNGLTPPLPFAQTQAINLEDSAAKAATSGLCYYAKKVAYYALKFFVVPLLFVLFSPVILSTRLISYAYNRSLHNEIKEARLQALKEGLKALKDYKGKDYKGVELVDICFSQYSEPKQKPAVCKFIQKVFHVKSMIQKRKNPDAIRKAIDEAMATQVYQKLKFEEENPAVNFLQILAVKDLSTDGREALKNYGKKVLGKLEKDTFSWEELADELDAVVGVPFAFQRNSLLTTALWAMTHPFEVLHGKEANWFPLEFNSHQGNPNIRGDDFSLGGKQMQFYYGPGPTGDRLYNDGVLVYMDKLNNRGTKTHELRMNFQNMHESSEAKRIDEIRRYEREHPDSMRLLSMSFDTEAMKMPKEFTQFETPNEFMLLYAKYVLSEKGTKDPASSIKEINGKAYRTVSENHKEDNGFFVGEKAITNLQFERAFTCAENIFTEFSESTYWEKLMKTKSGKQRLGRLMQLGTQAIISVGAVFKSLQEVPNYSNQDLIASRVTGACKQDIDRGIVENVALQLFFKFLTDKTLSLKKEEVYSIVGAVVGRAEMVEGRLIQWKRYEILSDLLHLMSAESVNSL